MVRRSMLLPEPGNRAGAGLPQLFRQGGNHDEQSFFDEMTADQQPVTGLDARRADRTLTRDQARAELEIDLTRLLAGWENYLADCLLRLEQLYASLHPSARPTRPATADPALTPELLTAQKLGAGTWDRIGTSWEPVVGAVEAGGPGTAGFVYSKAPGLPQHAFAVLRWGEHTFWLELQNQEGERVLPEGEIPRVPVDAHAIVVSAAGAVVRLEGGQELTAPNSVTAQTDPATTQRAGLSQAMGTQMTLPEIVVPSALSSLREPEPAGWPAQRFNSLAELVQPDFTHPGEEHSQVSGSPTYLLDPGSTQPAKGHVNSLDALVQKAFATPELPVGPIGSRTKQWTPDDGLPGLLGAWMARIVTAMDDGAETDVKLPASPRNRLRKKHFAAEIPRGRAPLHTNDHRTQPPSLTSVDPLRRNRLGDLTPAGDLSRPASDPAAARARIAALGKGVRKKAYQTADQVIEARLRWPGIGPQIASQVRADADLRDQLVDLLIVHAHRTRMDVEQLIAGPYVDEFITRLSPPGAAKTPVESIISSSAVIDSVETGLEKGRAGAGRHGADHAGLVSLSGGHDDAGAGDTDSSRASSDLSDTASDAGSHWSETEYSETTSLAARPDGAKGTGARGVTGAGGTSAAQAGPEAEADAVAQPDAAPAQQARRPQASWMLPAAASLGSPRSRMPEMDQVVPAVIAAIEEAGGAVSENDRSTLRARLLTAYRAGEMTTEGYLMPFDGVEVLVKLGLGNATVITDTEGVSRDVLPTAETLRVQLTEVLQKLEKEDRLKPRHLRELREVYTQEIDRIAEQQARDRKSHHHANQNTLGQFAIGGSTRSGTGLAGATRVQANFSMVFAAIVRAGVSLSGTMNQRVISTSAFKDAEYGRVMDYRADSTLVAYEPLYTIRTRTSPLVPWKRVTPSWSTDSRDRGTTEPATTAESLLTWIPSNLLESVAPQVVPVRPARPEFAQALDAARRKFPDTYFASGLTGLQDLYEGVVRELHLGGLDVRPGSTELLDLYAQLVMKLSVNLHKSVNDAHDDAGRQATGYDFLVHDRNGTAVAKVVIQSERVQRALYRQVVVTDGEAHLESVLHQRLGATSDKMHIEKVRTAIAASSVTESLTQSGVLSVGAAADALPVVPEVTLGPNFRAAFSASKSDSVSAGKTGLWVNVDRYTGPSVVHRVDMRHRAGISLIRRPEKEIRWTAWHEGAAIVVMPQWAAFAHGFSVDMSALATGFTATRAEIGGTLSEDGMIEFHPGAVPEEKVPREKRNPKNLPIRLRAQILQNHGTGTGLPTLEPRVAETLNRQVKEVLREVGLLSPDPLRPFSRRHPADRHRLRKGWLKLNVSDLLENERIVDKFLSTDGIEAHYDQIFQDGLEVVLRAVDQIGITHTARLLVWAEQNLDPNGDYYLYTTPHMHSVNLSIGSTSAGHGVSGSRSITLGGRFQAGSDLLQMVTAGVDRQWTKGAGQSGSFIGNYPELLESPGDQDAVRLPGRFGATLTFDDLPQAAQERLARRAEGQRRRRKKDQFRIARDVEGAGPAKLRKRRPEPSDTAHPRPGRESRRPGGQGKLRKPRPVQLTPEQLRLEKKRQAREQLVQARAERAVQRAAEQKTLTWHSDPVEGHATVFVLPDIGLEKFDPLDPALDALPATDPAVLEKALVYYLDTTGLVPLLRDMFPTLTGVGKLSDEQIANLGSTTMMRSFVPDFLHDEYQTGGLFSPGLISHTNGGLGIKGTIGPSFYSGASDGKFVASQIRLWLSQASHSERIQRDWVFSAGVRAGGPLSDGSAVGAVSGEVDATARVSRGQGTSVSKTHGKEQLPLSFYDALFFTTTLTLDVGTVEQVDGKLRPRRVHPDSETLGPRTFMYLLPVPRALAAYGRHPELPIDIDVVRKYVARWHEGELVALRENEILAVLDRLEREAADHADAGAILAEVATYRKKTHKGALEQFLATTGRTERDLFVPFGMRKDSRLQALGIHGVESMDVRPGEVPGPPAGIGDRPRRIRAVDILHQAVEQAVPGLIGLRRADWPTERIPEVWYRAYRGDQPVVGKLANGIDFLTSLVGGNREQAMLDDLLHTRGVTFYLFNRIGGVAADAVELNIGMRLTTDAEITGMEEGAGLETYAHQYAASSQSTSRSVAGGFTAPKTGLGGEGTTSGTSGGGQLDMSAGHRREVVQSAQHTQEHVGYDWERGFYLRNEFDLTVRVRRLDMVNRPLSNVVAGLTRDVQHLGDEVLHTFEGTLVTRKPGSEILAIPVDESLPLDDLTPVRLDALPADAMVVAVDLDDAVPRTWELLGRMFGQDANDQSVRSVITLEQLQARGHMRDHILETIGKKHLVMENIFVGGDEGRRAALRMQGDFFHPRVVAQLPQGTGVGRYSKHQIGTTIARSVDSWRPSLTVTLGQNGNITDVVENGGTRDLPAQGRGSGPTTTAPPNQSVTSNPALDGAGGTGADLAADHGEGARDANVKRDEHHPKEQGPMLWVVVNYLGNTEIQAVRRGMLGDGPTGTGYSDRFLGEAHLLIYRSQYDELLRFSRLQALLDRHTPTPTSWPTTGEHTPRYHLEKLLSRAALDHQDLLDRANDASRWLIEDARTPHMVLMSSAAHQVHSRYVEAVRWAGDQLSTSHPGHAAWLTAFQDRHRSTLEEQMFAPQGPPAGVVAQLNAATDELLALVVGGVPGVRLPHALTVAPSVPLPVARVIAHNTGRSVELNYTAADGTVTRHRIRADGKVLDAVGRKVPQRSGTRLLPSASGVTPVASLVVPSFTAGGLPAFLPQVPGNAGTLPSQGDPLPAEAVTAEPAVAEPVAATASREQAGPPVTGRTGTRLAPILEEDEESLQATEGFEDQVVAPGDQATGNTGSPEIPARLKSESGEENEATDRGDAVFAALIDAGAAVAGGTVQPGTGAVVEQTAQPVTGSGSEPGTSHPAEVFGEVRPFAVDALLAGFGRRPTDTSAATAFGQQWKEMVDRARTAVERTAGLGGTWLERVQESVETAATAVHTASGDEDLTDPDDTRVLRLRREVVPVVTAAQMAAVLSGSPSPQDLPRALELLARSLVRAHGLGRPDDPGQLTTPASGEPGPAGGAGNSAPQSGPPDGVPPVQPDDHGEDSAVGQATASAPRGAVAGPPARRAPSGADAHRPPGPPPGAGLLQAQERQAFHAVTRAREALGAARSTGEAEAVRAAEERLAHASDSYTKAMEQIVADLVVQHDPRAGQADPDVGQVLDSLSAKLELYRWQGVLRRSTPGTPVVLKPVESGYDTPAWRAGMIDRIAQLPADRWKDISIGAWPRSLSLAAMLNDVLVQQETALPVPDGQVAAETALAALPAPPEPGETDAGTSSLGAWAAGRLAQELLPVLTRSRDAARDHLDEQRSRRAAMAERFRDLPGVGQGTRARSRLRQIQDTLEHREQMLRRAVALAGTPPLAPRLTPDAVLADVRKGGRWDLSVLSDELVLRAPGISFTEQPWRPEAALLAQEIAVQMGEPVTAFAGDGTPPAWFSFGPEGFAPQPVSVPGPAEFLAAASRTVVLGSAPPGVQGFVSRPTADGTLELAWVDDDGQVVIADGSRPQVQRDLARHLGTEGGILDGVTVYVADLPEPVARKIALDNKIRLRFTAEPLRVARDGTIVVQPVPGTTTTRGWLEAGTDGTVVVTGKILSPSPPWETDLAEADFAEPLTVIDELKMPHQFYLHRVPSGIAVTDGAFAGPGILATDPGNRPLVTVDVRDYAMLVGIREALAGRYPFLVGVPYAAGPSISVLPVFGSSGDRPPGDGLIWRLPAQAAVFQPDVSAMRHATPARPVSHVGVFLRDVSEVTADQLRSLLDGFRPLTESETQQLRTAQHQVHALAGGLETPQQTRNVREDLKDSLARVPAASERISGQDILDLVAHGQNLARVVRAFPESFAEAREYTVPVPEQGPQPVPGRTVASVRVLEYTMRSRLLAHERTTSGDLERIRRDQEDPDGSLWNASGPIDVDGEIWYVHLRSEPVRDGRPVHRTIHVWSPVGPEGQKRYDPDASNFWSDANRLTIDHELGHQAAGLDDAYPDPQQVKGQDPLRRREIRIHARGSAAARGGPETRPPSRVAAPDALMHAAHLDPATVIRPSPRDYLTLIQRYRAGDQARMEALGRVQDRYWTDVVPALERLDETAEHQLPGEPLRAALAAAQQAWTGQAEFAEARLAEIVRERDASTPFSSAYRAALTEAQLLRQEADLARDQVLGLGSRHGQPTMPVWDGGRLDLDRQSGEYMLSYPQEQSRPRSPDVTPARADFRLLDRLARALSRPVVVDLDSLTDKHSVKRPVKPTGSHVRFRPDGTDPEMAGIARDLFRAGHPLVRDPAGGAAVFRLDDATVRVLPAGVSVSFPGDPHPGMDESRTIPRDDGLHVLVGGLAEGPDDRQGAEGRELSARQRQTLRTILAWFDVERQPFVWVEGYGTVTRLQDWFRDVTDWTAVAPRTRETFTRVPPEPLRWPYEGEGASRPAPPGSGGRAALSVPATAHRPRTAPPAPANQMPSAPLLDAHHFETLERQAFRAVEAARQTAALARDTGDPQALRAGEEALTRALDTYTATMEDVVPELIEQRNLRSGRDRAAFGLATEPLNAKIELFRWQSVLRRSSPGSAVVLKPVESAHDTPAWRAGMIDRIGQLPADRWPDISVGTRLRQLPLVVMLNDSLVQQDSSVPRSPAAAVAEETLSALPGPTDDAVVESRLTAWAAGQAVRRLERVLSGSRDAAREHLSLRTSRLTALVQRFPGVKGSGKGTRVQAWMRQAEEILRRREELVDRAGQLSSAQPRAPRLTPQEMVADLRSGDRWDLGVVDGEALLHAPGASRSEQPWRPEAALLAQEMATQAGRPVTAFADLADGFLPSWFSFQPDGSAPRPVPQPRAEYDSESGAGPTARRRAVALLKVTVPPAVRGFTAQRSPQRTAQVAWANDRGQVTIANGSLLENQRDLARYVAAQARALDGATLYVAGLPIPVARKMAQDNGIRLNFTEDGLGVSRGTVTVQPVTGTTTTRGWLEAGPTGTVTATGRLLDPSPAWEEALARQTLPSSIVVIDAQGLEYVLHLRRIPAGIAVSQVAGRDLEADAIPVPGRPQRGSGHRRLRRRLRPTDAILISYDVSDPVLEELAHEQLLRILPEPARIGMRRLSTAPSVPSYSRAGRQAFGDAPSLRMPMAPATDVQPPVITDALRAANPGRLVSLPQLRRSEIETEPLSWWPALSAGDLPPAIVQHLVTAIRRLQPALSSGAEQQGNAMTQLRALLDRARTQPELGVDARYLVERIELTSRLDDTFGFYPSPQYRARVYRLPGHLPLLELTTRTRHRRRQTTTESELSAWQVRGAGGRNKHLNGHGPVTFNGEMFFVRMRVEHAAEGNLSADDVMNVWPPIDPEGRERLEQDSGNLRSDASGSMISHEYGHHFGLPDRYPNRGTRPDDPLRHERLRVRPDRHLEDSSEIRVVRPSTHLDPLGALMHDNEIITARDLFMILEAVEAGDQAPPLRLRRSHERYERHVAPAASHYEHTRREVAAGRATPQELHAAGDRLYREWRRQARQLRRFRAHLTRPDPASTGPAHEAQRSHEAERIDHEIELAEQQALRSAVLAGQSRISAPGGGYLIPRPDGVHTLEWNGLRPRPTPEQVWAMADGLGLPVVMDFYPDGTARPGEADVAMATGMKVWPGGRSAPLLTGVAVNWFLPGRFAPDMWADTMFTVNGVPVRMVASGLVLSLPGAPHLGYDPDYKPLVPGELMLHVPGYPRLTPQHRTVLRAVLDGLQPGYRQAVAIYVPRSRLRGTRTTGNSSRSSLPQAERSRQWLEADDDVRGGASRDPEWLDESMPGAGGWRPLGELPEQLRSEDGWGQQVDLRGPQVVVRSPAGRLLEAEEIGLGELLAENPDESHVASGFLGLAPQDTALELSDESTGAAGVPEVGAPPREAQYFLDEEARLYRDVDAARQASDDAAAQGDRDAVGRAQDQLAQAHTDYVARLGALFAELLSQNESQGEVPRPEFARAVETLGSNLQFHGWIGKVRGTAPGQPVVLYPVHTGEPPARQRTRMTDHLAALPWERWTDLRIAEPGRAPQRLATWLNAGLPEPSAAVSLTVDLAQADADLRNLPEAPEPGPSRSPQEDLPMWAAAQVARRLRPELAAAQEIARARLTDLGKPDDERTALARRFLGLPGIALDYTSGARWQQARTSLGYWQTRVLRADALMAAGATRPSITARALTPSGIGSDVALGDRWILTADAKGVTVLRATGVATADQPLRPESGVLAQEIARITARPVTAFADRGDGQGPAWLSFRPDGTRPQQMPHPELEPASVRDRPQADSRDPLVAAPDPAEASTLPIRLAPDEWPISPDVPGTAMRSRPDGGRDVALTDEQGRPVIADAGRPQVQARLRSLFSAHGANLRGATLVVANLPVHVARELAENARVPYTFAAEDLKVHEDGRVEAQPVAGTEWTRGWLEVTLGPDGTSDVHPDRRVLLPGAAWEFSVGAIPEGDVFVVHDVFEVAHQLYVHRVPVGMAVTQTPALGDAVKHQTLNPATMKVVLDIADSHVFQLVTNELADVYDWLDDVDHQIVPGPRYSPVPAYSTAGPQIPAEGPVWRLPSEVAGWDPMHPGLERRTGPVRRVSAEMVMALSGSGVAGFGRLSDLLRTPGPLLVEQVSRLRLAQLQLEVRLPGLARRRTGDVRADLESALADAVAGSRYSRAELLTQAQRAEQMAYSLHTHPLAQFWTRAHTVTVPEGDHPVPGREVREVVVVEASVRIRRARHDRVTLEDLYLLHQLDHVWKADSWNRSGPVIRNGVVYYLRARTDAVLDGGPADVVQHVWSPVDGRGVQRETQNYVNLRMDANGRTLQHEFGHLLNALDHYSSAYRSGTVSDALAATSVRLHAAGSEAAAGGPETRLPTRIQSGFALMNSTRYPDTRTAAEMAEEKRETRAWRARNDEAVRQGREPEDMPLRPMRATPREVLLVVEAHLAGDAAPLERLGAFGQLFEDVVGEAAAKVARLRSAASPPITAEVDRAERELRSAWEELARRAEPLYAAVQADFAGSRPRSARRAAVVEEAHRLRQEIDHAWDQALKWAGHLAEPAIPLPGIGRLLLNSPSTGYRLEPETTGSPAPIQIDLVDRLARALERPVTVELAALTEAVPADHPAVAAVARALRFDQDGGDPEPVDVATDLFRPGMLSRGTRPGSFTRDDAVVAVVASGLYLWFPRADGTRPHPGLDVYRQPPRPGRLIVHLPGSAELTPQQRATARTVLGAVTSARSTGAVVLGNGFQSQFADWLSVSDPQDPIPAGTRIVPDAQKRPPTWPFRPGTPTAHASSLPDLGWTTPWSNRPRPSSSTDVHPL
ncbi:hypothetical protein KIH74_35290 [Kineosporia sp. J2-2]|uniref:Uncharacterized protein n=1 Tax=Kineosporia corallincola TaxID=2835133 RepID=A0ABS5TTY7_9ACTN|nr:hypothetical protein [Kineosporia corallincola]MBT0774262.1 hypothetical protein [Kineosporia corallincola]